MRCGYILVLMRGSGLYATVEAVNKEGFQKCNFEEGDRKLQILCCCSFCFYAVRRWVLEGGAAPYFMYIYLSIYTYIR